MLRLLLCFAHAVNVFSLDSLRAFKYTKSQLCFAQERILRGCMVLADNKPISGLRCAMACSSKNKCEGYSLETGTLRCYTRTFCAGLASSCAQGEDGFQHFNRLPTPESCTNGGIWDKSSHTCICTQSFAGNRCERRAESCEEVFAFGSTSERLESVIVPSPCISETYTFCSVRNSDVITHLAGYSGSGRFNRGWADYVKGFSDNSTSITEFWIGLENIRCLTARALPQDLIVNITLSSPSGASSSFSMEYKQFTVGDAATFFRYNFSTFSSSKAGPLSNTYFINNCLDSPSGIGFSTPDADHDNVPHLNANAAASAHSGWWFSLPPGGGPPRCNPFGVMFQSASERITDEHIKIDAIDLPRLYNYKIFIEVYLRSRRPA